MPTMKPAQLLVVLFAICLLPPASAAEQPPSAKATEDKPNIIFIMADDLGYADLGCYGQKSIKTPRLDQMAKEGMRFTQCYAGSTVCAPSRSVLMTGRHTGHTTVRGNFGVGGVKGLGGGSGRVPLRAEDVTVAEVLKSAGYVTAMAGKWGLGEPETSGHPNAQGFDHWLGFLNQRRAHNHYPEYIWHNRKKVVLHGNANGREVNYTHDMFTEFGLDFVKRHHKQKFFLYLPYCVPHAKYQFPPGKHGYEDQNWKKNELSHAAMVSRLDRDVGQLLDLLDELKLSEKTLVFFCSDNGAAERWEGRFDSSGPLRGRKRDLAEGGIRVPMLLRWKGALPAGSENAMPWWFADVLPVCAHLAGVKVPAGIDGLNVWPGIVGKYWGPGDRHMYWEFHERGFQQAVRWKDWKAMRGGLGGLDFAFVRDLEALVVGVFEEGVGFGGVFAGVLLGLRIEGEPGTHDVVFLVDGDLAALLHDVVEGAKVFSGVLVVSEAAGLLVEGNLLAETIRVVHEVAQDTAVVGVVDIAVRHLGIVRPAGRHEASPVAAGSDLATLDVDLLALVAARLEVVRVGVRHDAATVLEVILVLHLMLVAVVVDVAHVEEAVLTIGILREAEHGVRGLALIVPLEAPADGHGAHGMSLIVVDGPAGDVELVSALIVEVTVAGLPEPVPVVVDKVGVKLIDNGGALPEVPVEIFGRGGNAFVSDAATWLAAIAVGNLEFAPGAGFDHLVETSDVAIAAALGSVLDDDAVFLLGGDGHAAFFHIVAHGLLDVDVFASLGAPNGHEGVPVVRGGHRDGVQIGVVEGFANVGDALAVLVAFGLHLFEAAGADIGIGVGHVGDLDAFLTAEAADVRASTPVQSGHGDPEPVVGPLNLC